MKRYVELCTTLGDGQTAEIVEAELADMPFEGFTQEDSAGGSGVTLCAYMPEEEWRVCSDAVGEVLSRYGAMAGSRIVEPQNWNAEWERESFSPIEIDDMIVRGEQHEPHPEKGVFDIVVSPSMSFGSGHHATTRMMCRGVRRADIRDRRVLDMGCGTGILAIVAAKCGARHVDAVDIDPWSVESCRRSISLSGVEDRVTPVEGSVAEVAGERYDVILANINRNIIIADMPRYAAMLAGGGDMLLSGFLAADATSVAECCRSCSLRLVETDADGDWRMLHFRKQQS